MIALFLSLKNQAVLYAEDTFLVTSNKDQDNLVPYNQLAPLAHPTRNNITYTNIP